MSGAPSRWRRPASTGSSCRAASTRGRSPLSASVPSSSRWNSSSRLVCCCCALRSPCGHSRSTTVVQQPPSARALHEPPGRVSDRAVVPMDPRQHLLNGASSLLLDLFALLASRRCCQVQLDGLRRDPVPGRASQQLRGVAGVMLLSPVVIQVGGQGVLLRVVADEVKLVFCTGTILLLGAVPQLHDLQRQCSFLLLVTQPSPWFLNHRLRYHDRNGRWSWR
mmetsp:Transcript_160368/g.510373  ORF Transcript_160368/g.510373 Transcript_160368/m.510373 type:complete len:222 (+) Transcript_160368:65-730(+)